MVFKYFKLCKYTVKAQRVSDDLYTVTSLFLTLCTKKNRKKLFLENYTELLQENHGVILTLY